MYSLPLILELINDMKDSTLFTKFNIKWRYNNICIWEEDQWKVAFITPMRLYEPAVMFFGFCNTPPTFQAFMNHIFADYLQEKWLKIYMDDLGVHTKYDVALHHERTWKVLLWLKEHGLTVKLSKTVFDAPHMVFLGIIISQGKVEMDKKKLNAIKEWKSPTTVKGIWSFMGFATFYHKFISNFSNIVAPLNLLIWKDEPWKWTPFQQKAFEELKCIFLLAPVLQIPDVTWPFSIMADASLLAAEAVLLQPDTNHDLHPCAYFSCTFLLVQQNYNIYDQELLAVILALEEWCQYLQGTQHPIIIITDHKNLSYIKDPCKLSCHQARWSLFLQDFDIQWQVTPGAKMAPDNVLSRWDSINTSQDNQEITICPEPLVINALDLSLACHIQSTSQSDPLVLQAIENLQQGSPLFPHLSLNDWKFKKGYLCFKGQLYITPAAWHTLLQSLHESSTLGHAGLFCMKAYLQWDYWWPGLSSLINNYVAGSATCQQHKANTHPESHSLFINSSIQTTLLLGAYGPE